MIFAFADLELDEERFQLRRGGRVVELQPRVLDLLLYLVRHRDRVVTKQEILDAVWRGVAVTDDSVTRAVSLARLALGDRGRSPSLIVSVPRRGYRFQAPVRELARASAPHDAPEDGDGEGAIAGRETLLQQLGPAIDAALSGRGRIVLLVGEAGIGKTHLAEALLRRARRSGARLACAWGPDGGAQGYRPWAPILRDLARSRPDALAALAPPQRSALVRWVPELDDERGPSPLGASVSRAAEAERVRLFEAVWALLERTARERPLALCLDDLHAADVGSVALLEFVGQRIATLPVGIVATCREDEDQRAPQRTRALERLARLLSVDRWPLAPLRGDAVHAFVSARLGGEPAPALVEALERKTGGNPLLLGESLRSLKARGLLGTRRDRAGWETLLPEGIRHLLRPKLRRLSAGAIEALRCAAALGMRVDRPLLARCLPMSDSTRLAAHLRELEEAGLLAAQVHGGPLRFGHHLVRDALWEELLPPGEERRALHARIAATLEEMGAPSGEALDALAHHACGGVPLVEAKQAAGLARAAGDRASRECDVERAAAWHERALEALAFAAPPCPVARAEYGLALAAAQSRALGVERGRASYRQTADDARSCGRADLFAAAALGFAHRPVSSGWGDVEVIALLEEALAGAVDQAARIQLLSRLASELRYVDRPRAQALAGQASEAARQQGDPAALAQVLDDESYVRWGPADSEGWIALNGEIVRAARACQDLELVLRGQKGRVTGLLELGDVAAVDREMRACEATAEALRTPYARWLCAALRAMRALLDGSLEAAERHVAEALRLGEPIDSEEVALELPLQLVYLRVEQGRAGEIDRSAWSEGRRFPGAAVWRAARARVAAAAGDRDQAREELEELARRDFADVPLDRAWLPTLALSGEVACLTGHRSVAQVVEERLAPHSRLAVVAGSGLLYYGPVSHHLGMLAAGQSRWDEAIARFDAALEAEGAAGARIWAARSRIGCARALLGRDAAGDRPRAAALLGEALATARAGGLADAATDAGDLEPWVWRRTRPVRSRRPGAI